MSSQASTFNEKESVLQTKLVRRKNNLVSIKKKFNIDLSKNRRNI